MTAFALLPDSERRLYIEQVAARRGILPVIVEKDHGLQCGVQGWDFPLKSFWGHATLSRRCRSICNPSFPGLSLAIQRFGVLAPLFPLSS
jgi:hypothetical protein